MSATVDQRVVEMRFDNKHFEQNVSTTMSTLEKLKQKLRLDGATKGLDSINESAKKVDMRGIGTAVDTVNMKFSALQVMGTTALANITNSAVNAGKKIVSALTIDPIKTGFQEYETQINAVQTILANTSSKGTTIDQVNEALEQLNKYADQTIYNFTEMTRNIGTFTAAGIGLDDSVSAIKGIANLAAVSGSTSQQASTAMYQLSQALASGTVKLMDWNSVVNAGMGGEVFQNALKETARIHGIAIDEMIESEGSFRETLKNGWLTSEVLTETLEQFTMAAKEGSKEWEAYKKTLMDRGYTEAQANEILKMANTATDAATKVKTFTQLWDVLKESAQSGWSQTWKLIVGDFEEAKALLTPLADTLTGFINKMSDARNRLVEGALDFASPWGKIKKKLEGTGFENLKKVTDTIQDATDKLTHFQDVVNAVWRGDYKNADTGRYDLLEAAGYDSRVVQDLVNKGYQYKLTIEDVEASHAKFGLTMEKTTEDATDVAVAFDNLTEKQLRQAGLTEDEILLYQDLAKEAERTGKSISDLVDEMSEKDGRTLIIESFKNAGSGLLGIFTALKNAWASIFPPVSVVHIYNIIKAVNEFSEKLRLTDASTGELTDTAKKLERTFKGVFAIIDIFATVLGGGLRIALKLVTSLLGYFNLDILDVTAAIGDALVKFRDWIDSSLDFTSAIEKIAPFIQTAIESFNSWKESLSDAEDLPKAIAQGIVKWFSNLPNIFGSVIDTVGAILTGKFSAIPNDMIAGFANGVSDGISLVGEVMLELGKIILDKIKDVLGIHSPSKEFEEIGANATEGLIIGLNNGASGVWESVKGIGLKCIEAIKNIDFGSVFAGVISVGMVVGVNKLGSAMETFASPLEGIGEVLSGTGEVLQKSAKPIAKVIKSTSKVIKSFAGVMKAISFDIATKGIKNLAISIAILAAAIIALSFVEEDKLKAAVQTVFALAAILAGLAVATGLMSKSSLQINKEGATMDGIKQSLLGIAASLLLLGITLKMIGSMSDEQYDKAFAGVAMLITGVAFIIATYGLLIKGKGAQNIDKAGAMLLKLAGAMIVLTLVGKIVAGMKPDEMKKAGVGLAGLIAAVAILALIGKMDSKGLNNISNNLLKIAGAMAIIALVGKLIASMTWYDMVKAGVGILGLIGAVALLTLIGKIDAKSMDSVGANLLKISGAMAILAVTGKILSTMEWGDMAKAAVGLVALSAIVVGLVWAVSRATDKDLAKVGTTLLTLSVSIGILGLVVSLLGFLSIGHLTKGIVAIGYLGAVMAGLILATSQAKDCKGNLIVMTVAIGVMAAAVAALSLIDPAKLAGAVGAMSILMGVFALMVKATDTAKGSIATLIVMSLVVAILGVVMLQLGALPYEATLSAAAALSLLLVAVGAVVLVLGKLGISVGKALIGVVALSAMAIPLFLFAKVLESMNNVQNATANAQALVVLATVLTALMIPLMLVGALWIPAAIGIVALTAMAIPLLAFVGVLAAMQHIENATENVNVLINLMNTLTGMMVVLAIVGPMALIGVVALSALTKLIVGISAMVIGIGALMTMFPELEKFIDTGIPILEKLCYGIGSFIGNLVAGFMGAVAESLPDVGTCLSQFMLNAMPFVVGVKMVDASVLAGVGYLAGSVLLLTAADLIAGIGTFLNGGTSFASLGTELSMFMTNALPFITIAKTIDPAIMEGVKTLASMILTLTAADILDGLTSWFTGGSSLTSFGEQLPQLGSDISAFAANLSGFDDAGVASITCAANAIKTIAEAASSLPNDGGWAGAIFGENSIAAFGEQLPGLGTNLGLFATNLGTFNSAQVDTVTCAADAISAISKVANDLPNEGGWAGKIFGNNGIAAFASNLPDIGTNLSAFATNLGTFDDAKVATVTCAANAIKQMSEVAEGIDGQAEWSKKLFGDNSLASFGGQLANLGTNLNNFATNLGTFDDPQVRTVNAAIRALNAFSNLGDSDLSGLKKHLEGFGDKVVSLAEDIKSFVDEMPGGDKISTAIANIKDLLSVVKDISAANPTAASDFAKSLKDLANSGINAFVNEFSSSTSKSSVKAAAADLMDKVIAGFESKQKSVKSTAADVISAGIEGIKNKYEDFKDAGKYLVEGFATGIKNNKSTAVAEAQAMVDAVKAVVKTGLAINSPSKVFMEIGSSIPEGFAMGIDKFGGMVSASATNMGDVAIAGVNDSISKISGIVTEDIDASPVIRPVLDLTGVESKAGILSKLFDTPASMGVLANIGAISSMMNSNQNGSNDDVISAINRLRESLDAVRGDTYNINGITYDDGSNIKEAIEAIIKWATIERRV